MDQNGTKKTVFIGSVSVTGISFGSDGKLEALKPTSITSTIGYPLSVKLMNGETVRLSPFLESKGISENNVSLKGTGTKVNITPHNGQTQVFDVSEIIAFNNKKNAVSVGRPRL